MKKVLIVIATLILAMSCCMFVGCKDTFDGISDTFSDWFGLTTAEGTYKFYSVKYEEKTYKAGDIANETTFSADYFVLTVEEGGTWTATIENEGVSKGTWAKNTDGKYDFTVNGVVVVATISGKTLTIEIPMTASSNMTYVLKK